MELGRFSYVNNRYTNLIKADNITITNIIVRKEKNILFSAHRAGALTEVFYEMGEIVFEDLQLLSKGLPPRLCRKAELETVKSLRSKPVDVN